MVFYFTSDIVQPPVTLFMGFDKHESEYSSKCLAGNSEYEILTRKHFQMKTS